MKRYTPSNPQKRQSSLRETFIRTVLILIGLIALTWLSAQWSVDATRQRAINARVEQSVTDLEFEALMQALEQDPSGNIRSRAAKALGELNDTRAVNALERAAASDSSVQVQDTASKALALLREHWARTANKHPEYVGALAVAPGYADIVYLAELNELAVSRDGGDTWTTLSNPLPDQVSALAIDPSRRNVIYAGVDSLGLYKSSDGGETWQAVNNGLGLAAGVPLRITALAIDPDNPDQIYAARAVWIGTSRVVLIPLGLMGSRDGGVTWYAVDAPEFDQAIRHLVVTDGKLHATAGQQLISVD